jgi:hypothetical protein
VSSVRDLKPTGIELVASPGVGGMVVDGTGSVWVDVPWGLVRLSPGAWSATVWDAGDDAAFANKQFVRASASTGVWLVGVDTVRLFDGVRFARELPVPQQYAGGTGIRDLVQVGTELWIVGDEGIARCADGAWSIVESPELVGALGRALVVAGPADAVWSRTRDGPRGGDKLVRLDGERWTQVGGFDVVLWLLGGPGGIVVAGSDPEGDQQVSLWDGTRWRPLAPLDTYPVAAAVGPDGTVWVMTRHVLLRSVGASGWDRVIEVSEDQFQGLGVAGETVVVTDTIGVLRLDGDRLVRVWSRADAPAAALDVVHVAGDTVWAVAAEEVGDLFLRVLAPGSAGDVPDRKLPGWGRFDSSMHVGEPVVAASDGAIWFVTPGGSVVRVVEGEETVVRRGPPGYGLLPGSEGSVWLAAFWLTGWFPGWSAGDREVLGSLNPDGEYSAVHFPASAGMVTAIVSGADGSLWITHRPPGSDPEGCAGGGLLHWRDGWVPVPHPGDHIQAVGGAPDGSFWGVLIGRGEEPGDAAVARYQDGTWTMVRALDGTEGPFVTPAGSVCGVDQEESVLVCVDPALQVLRIPLGVAGKVTVAADGTAWVSAGPAMARLPITVPR